MKKKVMLFALCAILIFMGTNVVANGGMTFMTTNINSNAAILTDLESNQVIYKKHADKKIYPASLTKMMTAIVALEECPNLDQEVYIRGDIIASLNAQGASMAGFMPGERTNIRSLLYGTLLSSGGDAAVSLAVDIGGSEDAFVELMNKKAKEIGMKKTHFSNSTGLHDSDNYSTVSDLSVLLSYALSNDDFRWIFISRNYTDGYRTYDSTMFAKMVEGDANILGGKTGYTPEAGLCLASLGVSNGKEYILVTVGAEGTPQGEPLHIEDAKKLYSDL